MIEKISNNDRLIFVLGMHRSGTSLLTRGLMTLGAGLGKNLMPPESDNPKGFWEDLDVVDINESVVNTFCSWDRAIPHFATLQLLAPEDTRARAADLISSKLSEYHLQAIKDPRLTILLPFWQEVAMNCGCKAVNILAIRNPMEVALSLKKRNSFSIEHGLLLWLYYNLLCLQEIQGQFLVVSFEQLAENPSHELQRIGNFVQLECRDSSIQDFSDGVIVDSLRHHRLSAIIDDGTITYAKEIDMLYNLLMQESSNTNTSADQFRTQTAELLSLLSSRDFYDTFSSFSNRANLILDSGIRVPLSSRHKPSVNKGVHSSTFDVPQSYDGIAHLEIPGGPCILKIQEIAGCLVDDTQLGLTIHGGNYALHHRNVYAFDTASPYVRVYIGQGTQSVSISYLLLNNFSPLFQIFKSYRNTGSTHIQNEIDGWSHLFLGIEGQEFQQAYTQKQRIYPEKSEINFDVSEYTHRNIQTIRLNPYQGPVSIALQGCILHYLDGTVITLSPSYARTNAIHREDSTFHFLTNDSCCDFDIPPEKTTGIFKISFFVDYLRWDNEAIDEISGIIHELRTQHAKDINNQQKTIAELEKSVHDKRHQIQTGLLIPLQYQRRKSLHKHKLNFIWRKINRLLQISFNPIKEITYVINRRKIISSGMFKDQYYLKNNIDLLPGCIDTFRHYYFHGWKEGRNPHPLFDTNYYLDNNPDVQKSGINPLVHYALNGKNERRYTSALDREIKIIEDSGLFDKEWYKDQYPLTVSIEPITHYCTFGIEENKSPCPLFDTDFYFQKYCQEIDEKDSATPAKEINPLVHYITSGRAKNYRTYSFTKESILRILPKLRIVDIYNITKDSGLLLENYYLSQLDGSCEDPVSHYISIGYCSGMNPNPLFDDGYYIKQFPELESFNIPPLVHYILYGSHAGAAPCTFFDPGFYNTYYTNIRQLGIDPLVHFLTWGWNEWRRPKMDFFTPHYVYSNVKQPVDLDAFIANLGSYSEPSLKAETYANYQTWYSEKSPEVSLILLNWNKSFLSLDCLISLWEFTAGYTYEIVLVDNGSEPFEKDQLKSIQPYIQLVSLDKNRFYGEGNNIGVQHSQGKYIVFLNNDTIAKKNWLAPLINALKTENDIGAAGAKLLFPDGSLQEMGAFVDALGEVEQAGKHGENTQDQRIQEVDYCSGACLAMRKADFLQVLGFDYIWEPAYYEDNDLCWKTKTLGKRIVVVPESEIYHLEHVSVSNQSDHDFSPIIEQNKKKFLTRWKTYIEHGENAPQLTLDSPPTSPTCNPQKPNAMVYTPYPILLGGGERYLLTIAEHFQKKYNVYIVVPELYSRTRIMTIGRDLGLNLQDVQVLKFTDTEATEIEFDIAVVMGNEILPRIPAIAKKNIFHCQFPFKYYFKEHGFKEAMVDYFDQYDCILVNSNFTKFNVEKQLFDFSLKSLPVHIAYPPVGDFDLGDEFALRTSKNTKKIISIGRFFVGGHNKKHDFLINAFKALVDSHKHLDAELHLIGGTHTEDIHRQYLSNLQEMAQGYKVYFHPDLPSDKLTTQLKEASIYWHATGIDVDPFEYPEAMEHFGITPVEAMKACCIPIVPNKGGVCEIVRGCSEHILSYRNKKELVEITNTLFSLPKERVDTLREDVFNRSKLYGKHAFISQVENVVQGLLEPDSVGEA